jgi:hypothetical protein
MTGNYHCEMQKGKECSSKLVQIESESSQERELWSKNLKKLNIKKENSGLQSSQEREL